MTNPEARELLAAEVDLESYAWDWLDDRFTDPEGGTYSSDTAFSSDEMIDAWMAGYASASALSRYQPAEVVGLVEALEKASSDQTLHYMRSIYRMLREVATLVDRDGWPTLGGEVLADNTDWLDCHIDWLERTVRQSLAAFRSAQGEGK